MSLLCKCIENTNFTLQPKVYLRFLLITNWKHDSASQKPVTKLGFNFTLSVEYFVFIIVNIYFININIIRR
jgi:hypothetical protein